MVCTWPGCGVKPHHGKSLCSRHTCRIAGCVNPIHEGRTRCHMHIKRMARYGTYSHPHECSYDGCAKQRVLWKYERVVGVSGSFAHKGGWSGVRLPYCAEHAQEFEDVLELDEQTWVRRQLMGDVLFTAYPIE